jgi:hypothetical protein
MEVTRRQLLQWSASALALPVTLDAARLPTRDQVWDWQLWMNKLGPRYTGNPAHTQFVEFLASNLKSFGLEVTRDNYTFTRWDAHKWDIGVAPLSGAPLKIPVTSYYPYSGETPAGGVIGELVYGGSSESPKFDGDFAGKVLIVDCPLHPQAYGYEPWGFYTKDTKLQAPVIHATFQGGPPALSDFKKTGALGVILGWTDVSDANAAYQYIPFSRPLQEMPGLWVGRESTARLLSLAGTGAKVTFTLEATLTPDSPTDTLLATLPGTSSDEVIIVNTHTDGPNATEENGGVAILALAQYFATVPKSERRRTIVFVLATGHFAARYVPSIRGVIAKHPDLIQKAVGALTVEHLGCLEWADDPLLHYTATGKNEMTYAITEHAAAARVMLDSLDGSGDKRVSVVKPKGTGRFYGEGSALSAAGVPTIGYIPLPNYLLSGPPNGHIDKLSADLMHSQIEVFAKVIHTMDGMTAAQLKGV